MPVVVVCRYTIALLQAEKWHLFFLKTISARRRSRKKHVKSDPMGIICDDGLIVFVRPVDVQRKRISSIEQLPTASNN